ncbi:MAG: hypothetical protein HC883_00510 [Bdellovibrionaceae bacterium]|nr:hypothetical protein [Pseudobdellovibrionaceae bacterium]
MVHRLSNNKTQGAGMKCMKFKKGNDVKWQSQANGNWKHKRGEIVAVVPAGVLPDHLKYPGLRLAARRTRNQVSYIIREFKTGKHYWPWTGPLRKV